MQKALFIFPSFNIVISSIFIIYFESKVLILGFIFPSHWALGVYHKDSEIGL